ncbi:hypothetical protein [Kitasatospora sp. NPDC088351]|uniref:hypothetical protein n=1 Tax=Kitasatospora sp. NPDC088351 TaxID=3155180 RepID=UPI003432CB3E
MTTHQAAGGRSAARRPDGRPGSYVRTYTYDDHGNETSAGDARGFTTVKSYDSTDNLRSVIDPSGLRTAYVYDEAGHIATPGGTNTGSEGFGLLTSVVRQPVSESLPARTTAVYHDDAAHPGDTTRMVDPRGNVSRKTYDPVGAVTSATDELGNVTKYGYDTARGLLTSEVAPNGVAAGTSPGCTTPAKGCTTYSYDAWGNRTGAVDPLGHATTSAFDADGHRTSMTGPNGNTTHYTYDVLGNQTKVTRPDGTVLSTDYNPDGTVARTVDGLGAATVYAYDAQKRQTLRTDPLGRATVNAYDAAGRRTASTDPSGRVTTFTYDANSQPTSVAYSDTATPPVTAIGYDAAGRQSSMADGTGTSRRAYDAFGELVSLTDGAGAVTGYGYDENGNRTSITYPGGSSRTVTRTFDKANHLASVKDWNGKTTGFGYDGAGHWTSTAFPNGTAVTTTLDDSGQPLADRLTNSTSKLVSLTYTRDNTGRVNSDTPSGVPGSAQTYQYTALNQLKSATAGSATTDYAYDAADNPIRTGATGQVFDAANQLCWSTPGSVPAMPSCTAPPSGATAYTWDPQGNRTTATTGSTVVSHTYDQANRLTGVSSGGTTSTYTYNGAGLRTQKTTGTTAVSCTWDAEEIPNLLSDGSSSYIYGPDDLPVEQITGTGTLWFFHDQLGSTRALTDAAGSVAGAYAYTLLLEGRDGARCRIPLLAVRRRDRQRLVAALERTAPPGVVREDRALRDLLGFPS